MAQAEKWSGRSLPLREARPLVIGAARFIDDIAPVPGIRHAAILRSPHAHAKIVSIDATALDGVPGIAGVLTGRDVADMSRPFINTLKSAPPYRPCAVDRVRYVGEPIAVVVADSRAAAEDAIESIAVEYEILEAVTDPEAAAADDAPQLHEGEGAKGNIVHDRSFRYGDPEQAFSDAHEIVEVTTRIPRVNSTPMETFGVIAHYEAGLDRYTVWSNFQGPFTLHPVMSHALGVTSGQLRLISPPASGGSFGIKQAVYAYVILIALASRKLGVPVKWIEDRIEHLAASSSSTGRVCTMRGAFTLEGKLTGLDISNLDDVGAYLRAPEPASTYRMHGTLNGPYQVRNIAVHNRIVVTNTLPNGLNRGFGAPQFFFPLERLMDLAARKLCLNAAEIRRRNLVAFDQFPYSCPSGSILDSGDYHRCLDLLLERADYTGLKARKAAAEKEGRLFGIGLALALETSGSNMGYVTLALTPEERARAGDKSGGPSAVSVAFDPQGDCRVQIDSVPNGQGHATSAAQVAADALGLAPDDIRIETQLDTGANAWTISSGNYANRFSTAVLPAIADAAEDLARQIRILAAVELQCEPASVVLHEGKACTSPVANRSVSIRKLAALTHWNSAQLPDGVTPSLNVTRMVANKSLKAPDEQDRIPSSITYSFMCDLVALEVDRDTGRLDILAYETVHDVGNIVNPARVDGQVMGGFAQGLGAALFEKIAYDSNGALLSGTFADYLCPTAPEMPALGIAHVRSASPNTTLGTKGAGDGPTITVPVAIANALADATGHQDLAPPFTPHKVWSLLNSDAAKVDPPELQAQHDISAAGPVRGSGSAIVTADPATVWAHLFDADGLHKIIPGCQSVTETSPGHFDAKVRIGVAGISALYSAQLEIVSAQRPVTAHLKGGADSRLGHGSGEAIVELIPDGQDRTEVRYRYAARVGGTIASVGSRLINGAAALVIGEFFDALSDTLSGRRQASWQRRLKRILTRFFGAKP